MSTTIEIFPVDTTNISFGQVITESEKTINNFLESCGIHTLIKLNVNIQDNDITYKREVQLTDTFEWNDDEYAWFEVVGVPGGTDGYCRIINDSIIDPANPWWKLSEMEVNNKTIENIKDKFEKSKNLNRYWSFRRSAGQPGIIALSYGLICASIAKLTNGILWTDDGAWDYARFPAETKDFLDWYFVPEKALSKDKMEWSKRCIESIKEEIASA